MKFWTKCFSYLWKPHFSILVWKHQLKVYAISIIQREYLGLDLHKTKMFPNRHLPNNLSWWVQLHMVWLCYGFLEFQPEDNNIEWNKEKYWITITKLNIFLSCSCFSISSLGTIPRAMGMIFRLLICLFEAF